MKPKNRTAAILILLVLALFIPFAAFAAPVGKISAVQGNVDVTVGSLPAVTAKVGMTVSVGDILRAKSKSKAEVTFDDGNILRIAENTRLKVTAYAGGEKKISFFNLFRGKTQSLVKKLGRGSTFEIRTPTAVCGVRGTDFFTFFQNGVSGAIFKEGTGYGYNPNMPGDVKVITAGQAMVVSSKDAPPVIKPATAADIEKHLQDTAPPPKEEEKKEEGQQEQTGQQGQQGGDTQQASGTTPATEESAPPPPPVVSELMEPPPPPPATTTTTTSPPPTQTTDVGTSVQGQTVAEQQSTTTATTTFSTPTTLGGIDGTLSGSIDDTTNTGTISLSGTYADPPAPTTGTVSGTLSDGSTYDADMAGMPGSYRALMRGIYRKGDSIGYLRGDLSGTAAGGTVSTSGSLNRTGILGTVADPADVIDTITDFAVPQISDLVPSEAIYSPMLTDDVRGFYTAASYGMQGIEAVWSTITAGGTYSSDWPSIYGAFGGSYYGGGYYMMGNDLTAVVDSATGHVALSGNLIYLDNDYTGIIGLAYRGLYDPNNPSGTYESVGAGTASMAPLAFSGDWGSGMDCLFSNDAGNFNWAGYDSGIFGGLDPFWSGSGSRFLAMGTNDLYDAGKSHYLWNTEIYGSAGGAFYIEGQYQYGGAQLMGYTAGFWVPGATTINGSARAVYVDMNGAPGLLVSDNIEMTHYAAIGMWKAEGNFTPYPSGETGDVYYAPDWGYMDGKFAGHFNAGGASAGSILGAQSGSYASETTFLMNEVSGQSLNWGIYNLKLGLENTFSGKPEGDASWSAVLGGQGTFGYGGSGSHEGYWLAQADGTWYATGEVSGSIYNGVYLTGSQIGNIGGPYMAVNVQEGEYGTWIGQSIGSYSGTALDLTGLIPESYSSVTFFHAAQADDPTNGVYRGYDQWDDATWMRGRIGATALPWDKGYSLTAIGQYANPNNRSLFMVMMEGGANGNMKWIGEMGGRIDGAANDLDGYFQALFVRTNPKDPLTYSGGILRYTLEGNTYPDIDMWATNGSFSFSLEQFPVFGITPDDVYYGSSKVLSTYAGGAIYGDIRTARDSGSSWSRTYLSGQNWGIWSLTAAGLYDTLPGDGWTAHTGGEIEEDGGTIGNWIGEMGGNAWSAGRINGYLSAKYVTTAKIGEISSDLLGRYDGTAQTFETLASGVYTSAYETSVTYGGYWGSQDGSPGPSSLYANDYFFYDGGYYGYAESSLSWAGEDWGRMGITSTPWNDQGHNFLAIGRYDVSGYEYGLQTSYVMDTQISSRPMHFWDGESLSARDFFGQAVGLWTDGDIEGALAALYVGSGGTSAGFFTGYDPASTTPIGTLAGNDYGMDETGEAGLWSVEGAVVQTQKADNRYSGYSLQSDSNDLYAVRSTENEYFYGEGTNTFHFFNADDSTLEENYDLPWGIYRYDVDYGSFHLSAGKTPENDLTGVKIPVGGGDENESQESYWLGDLKNMAWEDGRIHGVLSGQYISRTQMGEMKEGPFYGLYDFDSMGGYGGYGGWVGAGVGVFEGERLAVSAGVGGYGGYAEYGMFGFYNGENISWSELDDMEGRLGATTALWDGDIPSGPRDFLALGFAYNYGRYPLWKSTLSGSASDNAMASAGGPYAFKGYMGGIVMNYDAENGVENTHPGGTAAALYVRPDGEGGYIAGYLTGDVVPNFYEDLDMFKATGTLKAYDMGATTLTPDELYWNLSESDAAKLRMTGDVSGVVYGKSLRLREEGQALDWGVISAEAGGGYGGSWPSGDWTSDLAHAGYDFYGQNAKDFIIGHVAGSPADGGSFFKADATFDEIHLSDEIFSISAPAYNVSYADMATSSFTVYGTYGDGLWQAYGTGFAGIEQDLAFAGRVESGTCGYFHTDSLLFADTVAYPLTRPRGIVGSTNSLLNNESSPLYGMGSYYAAAGNPLFEMNIRGYDLAGEAGETYYYGAYVDMNLQGVKDATTAYGLMAGLYAKRTYGEGGTYDLGIVHSSEYVTATLYPDVNPLLPDDTNYQDGTGMWRIDEGAALSAGETLGTTESVPAVSRFEIAGRIGSGTNGAVTGQILSFKGQDWGVVSAAIGGYGGSPEYTIAGGIVKEEEGQAVGYWLANAGHKSPDDRGFFDGTLEYGYFVRMTETGAVAGMFDGYIIGLHDSESGKFHGAATAPYGPDDDPIFFSARSSQGALFSMQDGTLVSKNYYRPYYRSGESSQWFDQLRYEQAYIHLEGVEDQTNGWAFEQIDEILEGEFRSKREYTYGSDNRFVGVRKGTGLDRVIAGGRTGNLDPVPNFQYSVSPFFAGNIVDNEFPGTTTFGYEDYILGVEDTGWRVNGYYPNGLVRDGKFEAILLGFGDLWNSGEYPPYHPDFEPASVYLIGEHGSYSEPQVFRTSFEKAPAGEGDGAFYGFFTGIILTDNTFSEYVDNTLDGTAVGLYAHGGQAGVLRGRTSYPGSSYPEIGMWEAEADFWIEQKMDSGAPAAADFLSLDGNGGYANIFHGFIGAGIDSGMYGRFSPNGDGGDYNGYIESLVGVSGHTFSLRNDPNWGIFVLSVGAANTYENAGNYPYWTGRFLGSGEFGVYPTPNNPSLYEGNGYRDLGYWTATESAGTWEDGRIDGNLEGEFLTFKKYGTIEAGFMGTVSGDHSWQAVGAGTWQKESLTTSEGDLFFSSAVQGRLYDLQKKKTGSVFKDPQHPEEYYWYSYDSDETRPYRNGNSTFTENVEIPYEAETATVLRKTTTRYDVTGPNNVYTKEVWTETEHPLYPSDSAHSTYTYESTTFDKEADYLANMIETLEDLPDWDQEPSEYTQYRMDDRSNINGIMGGVGDLWANFGSATATELRFMGDINKMDYIEDTMNLFAAQLVSFDPLRTADPYANSRTPDGAGGKYGAYYAYLGGAVETPSSPSYDPYGMETRGLSAVLQGLFFDQYGRGGIVYSDDISGVYYTELGLWAAGGGAYTYRMTDATDEGTLLASSWTPQYFAQIVDSNKNSYETSYSGSGLWGGIAASSVDSGAVSLLMTRSEDVTFGVELPADRQWKIEQTLLGGGYTGDPRKWAFYMNDPVLENGDPNPSFIEGNGTDYIGVKITDESVGNNAFSGNLVGVNADWASAMTYVSGGSIKGTFDPARSTWKAVVLGTIMSVDGFLNRIDAMGSDEDLRRAFEKATKIPAFEVGKADFTYSNSGAVTGFKSVNMNDVTFFTNSTDLNRSNPSLWATKNISGTYVDLTTPTAVPLTAHTAGNNMSATFNPVNWQGGNWGASVVGGGDLNRTQGPAAGTTINVNFKGAATGTYSTGTFGGVGAGLVKTGASE